MGSVKKYQSEKCSKTYNHRQHLYRHKQSCIKSVIHECIQCSKVFVRADTLKKHIKKCKKNSQQKEIVCSLYSKEFVKVWHLQRHLKKKCQCGNCNKTYSIESFYRCHIEKCNDKTSTRIFSTNISETYELLNDMRESETWEEYHFDSTEIDTEVSVVFSYYYL